MHKFLDPSQIEQKYGGDHPNLTQYWPINNSLDQQAMQEVPLEIVRIKNDRFDQSNSAKDEFYSLRNESIEFFDQKYDPLPGTINSIYIKTVFLYTTNKQKKTNNP